MIQLAVLLVLAWSCQAVRNLESNDVRVDVDLYVMSKCPDAVYAEAALDPVLGELKDIINLNMHFIGTKQEDGTFTCKHGPQECNGNIQQLCVQLHSKVYQRYDWLYAFVRCNNKQGMDAVGTFATAATCLKEAGIQLGAATKMLACMYGPGHDELLQRELSTTAQLGVQTSCTIQVEGNTICVRDGGEWKDCPAGTEADNFKEIFCASYATKSKGKLPPACRNLKPKATASTNAVRDFFEAVSAVAAHTNNKLVAA